MFDAFEKPSAAKNEAVALLEEVASKIDRARNPLNVSLTEFELDDLVETLRRGAAPAVPFEPDLAAMAIRAADASKAACLAALELLGPRIESVKMYRDMRKAPADQ
jgi:hypothetical protein